MTPGKKRRRAAPRNSGTERSSAPDTVAKARSPRLPREERERRIVQGAIQFFAEVGFGGDTRQLAKRLNITHALLFRYFPSKDALIERVYEDVYLGRWNPMWEMIIEDRSIPLRERLVRFYKLYAKTILSYEWVRLFMFAGLKGADMNRRFFSFVTERLVLPICREIREHYGLPGIADVPVLETERELVWGLNSRVFYFGVRKYIYGLPMPRDLDAFIEAEIRMFFDGVGAALSDLIPAPDSRRRGKTSSSRQRLGEQLET